MMQGTSNYYLLWTGPAVDPRYLATFSYRPPHPVGNNNPRQSSRKVRVTYVSCVWLRPVQLTGINCYHLLLSWTVLNAGLMLD